MQKLNKAAQLALVFSALAATQAHAVNTFGVDTAAIITDVTTVGTLLVAVAVLFMGYRYVRKLMGR